MISGDFTGLKLHHLFEFVKMSKVQTLRALVTERLAAAAEHISALFERATAENEEELCRSEEENLRRQQLLDQALSRRILLNPGLNQDFTETAWIKEEPEEQSVTQKEEQLPVPVPDSVALPVKTEESSELQQRQTKHREGTQGEDISSEPETEGHTEHSPDTDNDDDWKPPFSWSAAQMETEADEANYSQVQSRYRNTKLSPNNKSVPETTVHGDESSGPDGAAKKKHQCSVCTKRFGTKWHLQRHNRVHTGERPFSCSTCSKAFAQLESLISHRRTHTGEKPFNCSICGRTFAEKSNVIKHKRTHTGEKPFNCSICGRTFAEKSNVIKHKRTHTGEKPFRCLCCDKAFAYKYQLKKHMSIHGGQRPELDGEQSV